jgi:zinc transport system substrate-binding protein
MRRASNLAIGAAGSLLALSLASTAPRAADLKVVVTIKPLHALVSQVMAGVGAPELLVKGAASPHSYALKPSEARALHNADLFFRMSETVESFAVKVVKSLPKRVEVVTLQEAPGIKLLALRTGATFEPHSHAKDKAHGHGPSHDTPQKGDAIDGHAWLDPDNAKAMVDRVQQALGAKYPEHATAFKANVAALAAKLDALAAELDGDLKPIAGKPYIVFHDAFQYLERRFGLNVVGSISINPDVPPSARRLTELRRKVQSLGAVCVFAEPAFDRRLVDNLIEGTSARTGTLDAEGGSLDPGPDLYFALMRKLASALKGCLGAAA